MTQITLDYARNQRLPDLDLVANYNTIGVAGTQFEFESGFPPVERGRTVRSFRTPSAMCSAMTSRRGACSCRSTIRSAPARPRPGRLGPPAARAGGRTQPARVGIAVARQVREAGRQVDDQPEAGRVDRKAREFAERRLEAEDKRVTVGLRTTFQLLQAQRDLSSSRGSRNSSAIIDYSPRSSTSKRSSSRRSRRRLARTPARQLPTSNGQSADQTRNEGFERLDVGVRS